VRKPNYLSPSAISIFKKSKEEYYLQYLSEIPAPRFPQTQPMSIGSAFDAYVKSWLHEALFGKNNDPKFNLITLFEAQVSPENRDWAFEHGAYAFDCYKRSGALADLMLELQSSIGTPRFEIEIKGVVNGHREGITKEMPNGVVLLGKPDVFYINKFGVHVILDFKVTGWCSGRTTSPMAGYLRVRGINGPSNGPHKNCFPMLWKGTMINTGQYLNEFNEDWANQLSTYAWLLGCEVGSEFITAIDQLCCKPSGKFPEVKVAEHRLRVHPDHQWKFFAEAQDLWNRIQEHYYSELSYAESKVKCEQLEDQAKALANPETEEDALFNAMTRI
jgi:hypothetical protein